MNVNLFELLVNSGLNKKSRASSSTNDVYIKIPADIASSTPLTTFAVKLPDSYVYRTPRPTAIAIGVVRPYPEQRNHGSQERRLGNGMADMRAPIPRPSNDWWKTRTGYNVLNSAPVVPRFKPMITEWKITPNSRMRKAAICCRKERSSISASEMVGLFFSESVSVFFFEGRSFMFCAAAMEEWKFSSWSPE